MATASQSDESSYYVYTDKERYEQDDVVVITFVNPTSDTLYFPQIPPWWISGPTGIDRVYTPASIPDVVAIGPDETRNWSYDLRDEFGQKIPPGNYRANVEVWEQDDGSEETTVFDEFLACTNARPLPEGLVDSMIRTILCDSTTVPQNPQTQTQV